MAAASPAPARTLLAELVGTATPDVEARWTVPAASPLVTSLLFISWDIPAAPARPGAARSHLAAALLVGTRPPASAALNVFKTQEFLTHEGAHDKASALFHQLDVVGAFNVVYQKWEQWVAAIPGLWAKLADPALVRLPADFFVEHEPYAARAAVPPPEVAFLKMGIEKNIYWTERAQHVTFDATRVNNLPALDNEDVTAPYREARSWRPNRTRTALLVDM
jgi:hypothetical protein